MFALPFLFLFADPGTRPFKDARSEWFTGMNDFLVLVFGPALGRVVFCSVWLALVTALFYGLVIRRTVTMDGDNDDSQKRAGSPFMRGRLRNRPSRARK